MNTKHCLIADDNSMVVKTLKKLLEELGFSISICTDTTTAIKEIKQNRFSLAILAISNTKMNAIKVLEKLPHHHTSHIDIIVMTDYKEKALYNHVRKLGIKGYILKTFPFSEIEQCIEAVSNGDIYFSNLLESQLIENELNIEYEKLALLTATEMQVLEIISNKKNTKKIASELYIAETTVETHRRNIIKKLNLPPGQNSLLLWAWEHKLMIGDW